MSTNEKQKIAERWIDDFAAQLLALNNGKVIPLQWKNRLFKAIKPSPKRTRTRDSEQVTNAVKLLVLSRHEVSKGRTKHHNPATSKDKIAKAVGVSRKTIERIWDDLDQLESLDLEQRQASIDGIAAALAESLQAKWEVEHKAKEQDLRRRFPESFPTEK